MLSFDELKEIASHLNNGSNLKKEEKQKLKILLGDVLKVEGTQTIEERIVEIRDTIISELKAEAKNELKTEELKAEVKNELKTELKAEAKNELKTELTEEAKNELKADQALNDEVKAELSSEIQEKANKLEQIEKEKADLQTKFDAAEKEKTELQQQLDNLTKDDIENLFADGSIKTEIEGLIGSTGQELEGKIKDLYDGKLRSKLKEEEIYEKVQEGIILLIENGKNAGEIEEHIKDILKYFDRESKINELQQQLEAKDEEITALKAQSDAAVTKLEGEKTTLTNKIKDLEAKINQLNTEVESLKKDLKDKNDRVHQLEKENKELEAKINQSNTEVESLKKDLQARNARVQQLEKENKELEAKNKTTEQPKQGNGAKYTATVGMGLAAGLIAFTVLERTVRLEMLVMIGIAVTSALVVGGITYAVLPSAQVDGAKTQEVNENEKGK